MRLPYVEPESKRIKITKELIEGRRRRALQGRYSFIAQGASPGLIIETYLLSPKGAALPRRKANARVVVPLLRSSYFSVPVYPGFHIGLCPHSTLGYEEVSCLKVLAISLNFDAVTLSCDGGTCPRSLFRQVQTILCFS